MDGVDSWVGFEGFHSSYFFNLLFLIFHYFSDLEPRHQPERQVPHFFRTRQDVEALGEDSRTSGSRGRTRDRAGEGERRAAGNWRQQGRSWRAGVEIIGCYDFSPTCIVIIPDEQWSSR